MGRGPGQKYASRSIRQGFHADQKTLPLQLEAMRRYAADRGWTVASEVHAVGSGAKDRPQRALLLTAARRRDIDAILVWKLDRFGRSLPPKSGRPPQG